MKTSMKVFVQGMSQSSRPSLSLHDESGQAVTEYILMVATIVGFFTLVVRGLSQTGLTEKMKRPLTDSFRYTYQYGHPLARGYNDPSGPKMHPRIAEGDNFRIFIDPGKR